MLIAIDIGNTSINIGYFTESGLLVQKIATHPLLSADAYSEIFNDFMEQNHLEKKFISCIISSVVTSHTAAVKNAAEQLSGSKCEVVILTHDMDTGLNLKIKAPEEMGTDRLANAAGAFAIFGGPVAAVDFGTATTITIVGSNGDVMGGAILPGIGLMNDMLAQRTSRLKKITLEPAGPCLGRDTAGSLSSGLLYGTTGAVERILCEIEKETGCIFTTVITGGYAYLVAPILKRPHELNPNLTLFGLQKIYAKNRHARAEEGSPSG